MSEPFRTPYTGYEVLDKRGSVSWDGITGEVVRKRLQEIPQREFLDAEEWQTLEAICSRLLPQPDRADPVPIVPFIDRKLKNGEGPGYRHESMPELRRAWRLGIAAIEAEASARFQRRFPELDSDQQDALLHRVQAGDVETDAWRELPADQFFSSTLLKTVVGIYYAHPAAWSEVGFGGPASPRGYVRRELGTRDRWEAREEWNPVSRGEDAE